MDQQTEVKETAKTRPPLFFVLLVLILLGIFVSGLKWVFTLSAGDVGSTSFLVFDYAVGLTMIFLPCTLPLAFVIVPMVMGRSYQKGIGMVLAFGLGVTITLSLYGALIGLLGQVLAVSQVETAKNILYAVAGLFAIFFALGELGLIKFKAPTYAGGVPQVIMRQKDLVKAGLLGLFLGNVGVGCPNPLFNAVIIPQIIATGSSFQGFVIMLVQALGRITPLFILAFLAILGINATSFLVKHKDKVTKITGWTSLYVGGFLLTLGLFGHDWWVISGMHTLSEIVTQENFITNLLGSKVQELGHTHGIPTGAGLFGMPIAWGIPFILFVWILPMVWYLLYKKKSILTLAVAQQAFERRYTRLVGWFFGMTTLFLIVVFGYYLPHMLAEHWSKMGQGKKMQTEDRMIKKQTTKEQNFHVSLSSVPSKPQVDKPFNLKIDLHDKDGKPIRDLQISHERILHVILVSEDLEEFKHVHPEDFAKITDLVIQGNEFQIPITLSKAGRYRVLVDAVREGIGEVLDVLWFEVGNKEALVVIRKDLTSDRIFNGYEVSLQVQPEKPKSGEKVQLSYFINSVKTGDPIFDIEPYLGADMHVTIMSVDLTTMIHTHGVKGDKKKTSLERPEIIAPHTFAYPGIWKIYGQFQHKGKVITTEFMIEALPNALGVQKMVPHIDDHKN